jgi:hypothetical protein
VISTQIAAAAIDMERRTGNPPTHCGLGWKLYKELVMELQMTLALTRRPLPLDNPQEIIVNTLVGPVAVRETHVCPPSQGLVFRVPDPWRETHACLAPERATRFSKEEIF